MASENLRWSKYYCVRLLDKEIIQNERDNGHILTLSKVKINFFCRKRADEKEYSRMWPVGQFNK